MIQKIIACLHRENVAENKDLEFSRTCSKVNSFKRFLKKFVLRNKQDLERFAALLSAGLENKSSAIREQAMSCVSQLPLSFQAAFIVRGYCDPAVQVRRIAWALKAQWLIKENKNKQDDLQTQLEAALLFILTIKKEEYEVLQEPKVILQNQLLRQALTFLLSKNLNIMQNAVCCCIQQEKSLEEIQSMVAAFKQQQLRELIAQFSSQLKQENLLA